jgi:hypothetical protein
MIMKKLLLFIALLVVNCSQSVTPDPTVTISADCCKWIGYFSPLQMFVVVDDTVNCDSVISKKISENNTNDRQINVDIRCSGDIIIHHKYQHEAEWIIDTIEFESDTTIFIQ